MLWFTIGGAMALWGLGALYFQPRFREFMNDELDCDGYIALDDQCYSQSLNGATRLYKCGHYAATSFRLYFFGVLREPNPELDYCRDCALVVMSSQIIRCAACGGPIFPGDTIAKRCSANKGMRMDIAIPVDDYASICCISDNDGCGSIPIGTWGGDGIVWRELPKYG